MPERIVESQTLRLRNFYGCAYVQRRGDGSCEIAIPDHQPAEPLPISQALYEQLKRELPLIPPVVSRGARPGPGTPG